MSSTLVETPSAEVRRQPNVLVAIVAVAALAAQLAMAPSLLDALRDRGAALAVFVALTLALHAVSIEISGRESTSFADLKAGGLLARLRPAQMERAAPERLKLPGGRWVQVHYEAGKPPWIESRLQDFFGMVDTPRVNGAPVVVHLLAPNHRPVQVTSDLKGFWERLYPQVRRELMRRYPKHKWPENPTGRTAD